MLILEFKWCNLKNKKTKHLNNPNNPRGKKKQKQKEQLKRKQQNGGLNTLCNFKYTL